MWVKRCAEARGQTLFTAGLKLMYWKAEQTKLLTVS